MSALQVNSGVGGGGGGGGGKTEVKRNSHVSLVSGGKEDSAMQNSKMSWTSGNTLFVTREKREFPKIFLSYS